MRKLLSLKLLVVSLGLILLLAGTAGADTKKISGTTNVEDTWLSNGGPDNNYGGDDKLIAAVNYKTLIRVKNVASELGVGATITFAACSMYCYSPGGELVNARRVFKPWVEGDEDGVDDDDGDATWNDWASDEYEWTTGGCGSADDEGEDNSGDGTGADRKSTAESSVDVSVDETWYGFSISTTLAQGWYDETINEEGIHLESAGTNYFRSTEYASNQPFFVFTYTTDGPPPAAGQVIIIGARDEEDYHNPRLGIPPAAWE